MKKTTTKIVLEYPFSDDWETGYLNKNREGRLMVYLYNPSNKKRSTVSYARYLMSCKMKRYLLKSEHVDHKDEDKTNDDIDNLQLISQSENNKKHVINSGKSKKVVDRECPHCKTQFKAELRNAKTRERLNQMMFCSRHCSGSFKR